jgi:CrcB protein
MLKNILLVGIGGFAGSISRYLVYAWLERGRSLPLGTMTVNFAGSLILGIFIGYYMGKGAEPNNLRLLLAVGFCGSFTTFSTFALEMWDMLTDNRTDVMILYLLASITGGLLLVFIGIWLGKMI